MRAKRASVFKCTKMQLVIKKFNLVPLGLTIMLALVTAQVNSSPVNENTAHRIRSSLAPKLKSNTNSEIRTKEPEVGAVNQTSSSIAISAPSKPPASVSNKHYSERSISSALNNNNNNNRSSSLSSSSGRLAEFIEDELPPDFYEMPPEQLDLGMNATGRAPVPILNVAVLQNGQTIDNEINVHPGTPLEMAIYLDEKSSQVYGLLASSLKVQDDTYRRREEVIISNGCSIDTYIFGNFELNPDDQSLRAKFRAFKFPDSNFVRFVGTVNVCIKQCALLNCNGSRRKRATEAARNDRLVLTVSTVLRISDPSNLGNTNIS